MAAAATFEAAPEVLIWARRRWGLSAAEAAHELKIGADDLTMIEAGLTHPTVTLLTRMATKYHVSLTTLILAEPPPTRELPEDFRTVGGSPPVYTAETLQAIALTHVDQEAATDLARDLDEPIAPDIEQAILGGEIESLARRQRSILQISAQEQFTWHDARQGFRRWRASVEAQGILVFQRPLQRTSCRGFSTWATGFTPTIVVSSVEAPQAQTFTLLHEYGHLLLRQPGLCNEDPEGGRPGIERFCNQFAAAVLMPHNLVEEAIDTKELPRGKSWRRDDIVRLANVFRTSQPATALRLQELGLVPGDLFQSLGFDRDDDVWRAKTGYGRAPYARRALNRLGSHYIGLVLETLDRGMIDVVDADFYIDLKAKHLSQLREEYAAVSEVHFAPS